MKVGQIGPTFVVPGKTVIFLGVKSVVPSSTLKMTKSKKKLIFVTNTTNISGEKFVMWRNFRFQISKYDRNGEIWSFSTYGEISPPLACVWCGECLHIYVKFILFCCTIVFVTIYAVLSLNMFCCDSCTFVWRKFNQKLHMWWKSDKFGPLLPIV